jgi:hypothetical protein
MPKQRVNVPLSDIRHVSQSELSNAKLNALENGYDSFEYQLNSSSNPIALTGGKPYDISDGRHRIFLARQKGYKYVPAIFV